MPSHVQMESLHHQRELNAVTASLGEAQRKIERLSDQLFELQADAKADTGAGLVLGSLCLLPALPARVCCAGLVKFKTCSRGPAGVRQCMRSSSRPAPLRAHVPCRLFQRGAPHPPVSLGTAVAAHRQLCACLCRVPESARPLNLLLHLRHLLPSPNPALAASWLPFQSEVPMFCPPSRPGINPATDALPVALLQRCWSACTAWSGSWRGSGQHTSSHCSRWAPPSIIPSLWFRSMFASQGAPPAMLASSQRSRLPPLQWSRVAESGTVASGTVACLKQGCACALFRQNTLPSCYGHITARLLFSVPLEGSALPCTELRGADWHTQSFPCIALPAAGC
jgi:hypothetical protein